MTVYEYAQKLAGPVMISSCDGAYTLFRGPREEIPPELRDLELRAVHGCLYEGEDGMLHSTWGPNAATRLWVNAPAHVVKRAAMRESDLYMEVE